MSIFSRLFGAGKSGAPVVTSAALLDQVANRPMLMSYSALAAMISAAETMSSQAYREAGDWLPEGSKPEHLISIVDGVGYVQIHGPLFPRYDIYTWWFGGAAYDMIGAAVEMLAADAGVTQIVLDIDSAGGRVQGCFECAARIIAARASKPITAYVNDAGYSAGYALACSATRVVITQTAGVGSVGVIGTHVDYSRMLDAAGIRYTLITSGEKKADLSPTAPISDRAKAEMQDEINRLGEIFFAHVSAARPALSVDEIRAMQAGCYFGPAAIAAGLADEVGALVLTMGDDDEELQPVADPENEPEAVAPIEQAPQMQAPTLSDDDRARIARGAVADLLASAGLPAPMTAALLAPSAGVTPENAADRIATARELTAICFAAGLPDEAANYAARGVSVETARAQLMAVQREDGPELITSCPHKPASTGGLSANNVYKSRRRAAAAGTGT